MWTLDITLRARFHTHKVTHSVTLRDQNRDGYKQMMLCKDKPMLYKLACTCWQVQESLPQVVIAARHRNSRQSLDTLSQK